VCRSAGILSAVTWSDPRGERKLKLAGQRAPGKPAETAALHADHKTVIVVMTLANETKNVGDCPELYSEKDYLG